jgi:hypothetical protein
VLIQTAVALMASLGIPISWNQELLFLFPPLAIFFLRPQIRRIFLHPKYSLPASVILLVYIGYLLNERTIQVLMYDILIFLKSTIFYLVFFFGLATLAQGTLALHRVIRPSSSDALQTFPYSSILFVAFILAYFLHPYILQGILQISR